MPENPKVFFDSATREEILGEVTLKELDDLVTAGLEEQLEMELALAENKLRELSVTLPEV